MLYFLIKNIFAGKTTLNEVIRIKVIYQLKLWSLTNRENQET